MQAVYQNLAERLLKQYDILQENRSGQRLLIAIAGPPGSGKTTSTIQVASILNAERVQNSPLAVVVSMDGYHYPRAYLDTLPNREEAYIRRGAPWTFDAAAVVSLVKRCRLDQEEVHVPTFDHAVKDPVPNGLLIQKSARIIIFEGNYLLGDEPPWSEIRSLVDGCWLFTVDEEVARQRVARRHVASGIETNMADALARVDANDTLNGRYIIQHSKTAADITIESVEEANQAQTK
jgi:pantothenate kinase